MNSFEFNKFAGAGLGAVLFVMVLGITSDAIYSPGMPETPGYVIEIPEVSDVASAGGPAAEEIVPIAVRLAGASADAGIKVAKKCVSCHLFAKGGENRVGPALWDVIGRSPASHAQFSYSKALSAFAADNPSWTYESLDGFLQNPKKYVSGTSMSFAGLKKPKDRANIIAYLRSLSDAPQPLPEAQPEQADQ